MLLSVSRWSRLLAAGALLGGVALPAWSQKVPVTFNVVQAGSTLQGTGLVIGRYPTNISQVGSLALTAQSAPGQNGSIASYMGTIDTVLGFSPGSNALNSFQLTDGDIDALPSGNWQPANWNGSSFDGGIEPADYGFRVLSFVQSALRDVVLDIGSAQQTVTPGGTVALNSQYDLRFKSGVLDLDAEDLGSVTQDSLVDDIEAFEVTGTDVVWRNIIGRNEYDNPLYNLSGTSAAFSSGVDNDMFESDPVRLFNANGEPLQQILSNQPLTAPNSNMVITPSGSNRNLTLNLDVNASASFFLGDFLVKFTFDGALQATATIPNDPYPLDGDGNNDNNVNGADFTVWADNFGEWPKQQVDYNPSITGGADAPANGQLSSDATFQVVVENLSSMTSTTTSVTVPAAATSTNASRADLVADVNAALSAAGLTGQVTASVDGNRVNLSLVSSSQLNAGQASKALTIVAAPGTTAQSQLGFTNAGPAAFKDYRFRSLDGKLSDDATFSVKVGNNAPVNVTVTEASTAGNATPADLAADMNAAFSAAGLTFGNASVVFDQTARFAGSNWVSAPNIGFTEFTVQLGAGSPILVSAVLGTTNTLDALVTALNNAMTSAGVTNVQAANADGILEFRVSSGTDRLTITTSAFDGLVTNCFLQTNNVSDARYRMSFNSTGADGDNELVEITAAAGSVAVNELGIFQIDQKRGGIRRSMLTTQLAATSSDGDFNADGVVNGADFTVWADNFGAMLGQPVPEPAAWALLTLGFAAMVAVRKRFTA